MLKDGPKKVGRFIKRDSKVMEKVSLEDFSFADISAAPTIEQDNSRRTIVHSKYHSEEELEATVIVPRKFEEDLSHLDTRRPIIYPTDFTTDWEKEKKLRKDRNQRQDEDDDFSYNDPYESSEESQYDLTEQSGHSGNAGFSMSGESTEPRDNTDSESEITRLHTPLKIAGPAIKEFSQNAVDDKLGSHFSIGAVQHSNQAPINLEQSLKEGKGPEEAVLENPPPESQEDFIPNQMSTEEIHDPEQISSDAYKKRIVQEKADLKIVEEYYEEAKARGFQDGYRLGEEKGELQVRQNAAALFEKVQGLVESFMELKSTVLENVQENFYNISQAVAESLLKRELAINPNAFAAVVRKAIKDAVAPNQFKIRVNPKTADRLSNLADKEFLQFVVKDPGVEEGDFKIESELTVVDVNISKLVSELIEQTDINLFEDAEKAG